MIKSSVKFMLGDKEIDLFYISTLSDKLGRSSQTLRKWEISGVIPKTPFKDNNGNRLYTQEQIDLIVKIAEDTKIGQGRAIRNTYFSSKLNKELLPIHKKYIDTIKGR